MSDLAQDQLALASPFALMLPETARLILARAAALKLPSRRCSPLSNPRLGGAPMEAEVAEGELPL